jgi:hypothetical protein
MSVWCLPPIRQAREGTPTGDVAQKGCAAKKLMNEKLIKM